MQVARRRLMVLLNALYDQGVDSIPVEHPCDDIGELLRVELDNDGEATVRFTQGSMTYQDNRETVPAKHGEPAYNNLPDGTLYRPVQTNLVPWFRSAGTPYYIQHVYK